MFIIAPHTHQPKLGSQAGGRAFRRGEGGWERMGGPLWSPVGGEVIVFLHDGSQGNRTRATMKAINAAPHRPSTTLAPTDADGLFLRLMPIGRNELRPYVLIGSRCSILNQISCLFTSS